MHAFSAGTLPRAVAREAALVKVEYPWEATRDETGAARYVNRVTKEILDRHPLDDRFLALVQRCGPTLLRVILYLCDNTIQASLCSRGA